MSERVPLAEAAKILGMSQQGVREHMKRNSVVPIMEQKLVEANCGYLKEGNRPPALRLDPDGWRIQIKDR